jgi:hypothetical protein
VFVVRNTLISLIILVLIFPTISHAQVQAAPLFGTIVKEMATAALTAVASEAGKSAIDHFKTLFNKNKKIADKFGKPQLKKGEIANNKRIWSLSPTGSLKKEDIAELAKTLKSIDNNTDQEISAKIGNNNRIIISTQSGKVVVGNETTNINISGNGNATNIGSVGQSGGITNVVIAPPSTIENVECGEVSPAQDCPLEIDAYSWPIAHREGSKIEGIMWGALDCDIRVTLNNRSLRRIQNVSFVLNPETHIHRAVQVTNTPGVVISPIRPPGVGDIAITTKCEDGTDGELAPSNDSEFLARQARLQSSELLANGEIKIVMACVALNAVVNGEPPKTLFALRHPPKWILIDGTYEIIEAGSHKRFHFRKMFQLTK